MDSDLKKELKDIQGDLTNLMYLGDVENHLQRLVDLAEKQSEQNEEIIKLLKRRG